MSPPIQWCYRCWGCDPQFRKRSFCNWDSFTLFWSFPPPLAFIFTILTHTVAHLFNIFELAHFYLCPSLTYFICTVLLLKTKIYLAHFLLFYSSCFFTTTMLKKRISVSGSGCHISQSGWGKCWAGLNLIVQSLISSCSSHFPFIYSPKVICTSALCFPLFPVKTKNLSSSLKPLFFLNILNLLAPLFLLYFTSSSPWSNPSLWLSIPTYLLVSSPALISRMFSESQISVI